MSPFTQVLIAIVGLVGMVTLVVGLGMVGTGAGHDAHIAILVSVVAPVIGTLLVYLRQNEMLRKMDDVHRSVTSRNDEDDEEDRTNPRGR